MPVRPSINNINLVNKTNLIEQAQNFELKNFDMKSNEEEKEKFRQKKKNEETNPSGSIPPPLEHVKIYFDEKNFPAVAHQAPGAPCRRPSGRRAGSAPGRTSARADW